MSPFYSYISDKFNAKFKERRYFSAPESTLSIEAVSLVLNFFDEVSKQKDFSLLVKSVAESESVMSAVLADLVHKGYIEEDVQIQTVCESVSHAIMEGFLSPFSGSAFNADNLPDDVVKCILEQHPIRQSVDRLMSLLALNMYTLREKVENKLFTKKVLNPDVLALNDTEKAFFVIAGARLISNDHPLSLSALPVEISHNPVIMAMNRRNGLIIRTLAHSSISKGDKERAESYSHPVFSSAIEALAPAYMEQLMLDDDLGKGDTPYRRSEKFLTAANQSYQQFSAISDALLQVSDEAKSIAQHIQSATSYHDIIVAVSNIEKGAESSPVMAVNTQELIDHSYLLQIVAEKIVSISEHYASHGIHGIPRITTLTHGDTPIPKLLEYPQEQAALHKLLSGKLANFKTSDLPFCMESMNLEPFNQVITDYYKYVNNNTVGHAEEMRLTDLLCTIPVSTVSALMTLPGLDEEQMMALCKLAKSTSVEHYSTQGFRLENAIAECYAKWQLKQPEKNIYAQLEKDLESSMLYKDNVTQRFMQIINSAKEFIEDKCASGELGFIQPVSI